MSGHVQTSHTTRDYHFDSMRGIAACMVAIAHFLAAFYPYSLFGHANGTMQISAWESWLLYPPFSLLTASHFAVCLFFVLSGYVLCFKFIGEKNQFARLFGAMAKRPLRLGGVLVFSLLCAGLLFQFNGFFNKEAAQLSQSDWLAQFWLMDFSWAELFKKIITFSAGSEYNPPLWTLKIELIGSYIVFGLMVLINCLHYRYRTVVLLVCLAGLFSTLYVGFIFGMLFADAYKNSKLFALPKKVVVTGFLTAILMATLPYYSIQASISASGKTNHWLQSTYTHIPMLAAALLMMVVISSPALQRALQKPFLIWLGKVSYALYAMHLLIIGSLLAFMQTKLAVSFGYGYASLINLAIYVILLLIASLMVTKLVDEPAVRFANSIDRFVRPYAAPFGVKVGKLVNPVINYVNK